jgi:hypothetical protein
MRNEYGKEKKKEKRSARKAGESIECRAEEVFV